MSRTRNSAWAVGGGLLFSAVAVLCGLLATPWLLRWLGAERFGAFKALSDWTGYLGLLDLGLGGAMLARLGPDVGRGDRAAVRAALAAGLRASVGVTLLTLAGGLLLVALLPSVIRGPHVGPGELRAAGLLALIPVLLTPLLVFRALAEARQRAYLLGLLLAGQTALTTGLCLLAARAGWGLAGQSLAAAAAQIPAALALARDGARAVGGVRPSDADRETGRSLAALRPPAFVHGLADRVGLVSDSVIIAGLLGPSAVTPFVLTQQLSLLAQFQLRSLGGATWAGLVELHAQGRDDLFRRRLRELTGTVSGLGLAVLGPIAAYNSHFLRLWVGPAGDAGAAVTLIACANAWLWALFSLWSWPLLGAGQIARWTPYSAAFVTVNVLVSLAATRALGLPGPLIGSAAGFLLVDAWAMPRVLRVVFGTSPASLWRTALAPLAWGLPYAGLLGLVARAHRPGGWLGLGAEMAAAVGGGLVLWWMLGLDRETRLEWRRRLREVFRFG